MPLFKPLRPQYQRPKSQNLTLQGRKNGRFIHPDRWLVATHPRVFTAPCIHSLSNACYVPIHARACPTLERKYSFYLRSISAAAFFAPLFFFFALGVGSLSPFFLVSLAFLYFPGEF